MPRQKVILTASAPVIQPSGTILYTGRNSEGRLAEIGVIEAVEDENVLVSIHAMPLEWER